MFQSTLWRSFLSRSSHPLLPHLGPAARRHGLAGSVVLASSGACKVGSRSYYSDWIDYEWFSSDGSDDDSGADASDPEPTSNDARIWLAPLLQRWHLYLGVDDWSKGFSLHKLDLLDEGKRGRQPQSNQIRRLPPPAMRLEFPKKRTIPPLVAIGNKIIACTEMEDGITAIYNTRSGAQTMARCHPNVLYYNRWQAAMVADDTLYAFISGDTGHNYCSTSDEQIGSTGGMYCLENVSNLGRDIKEVSWKTDPFPLPFKLENGCGEVTSYAVPPGGKTIFVSVNNTDTYSYHTKKREWMSLGTWSLPFTGHAYYDDELEAWVGYSRHRGVWKIGCCDVPSTVDGSYTTAPSWKMCKEIMSSLQSCLDFEVVNMGGGWFCLVESLPYKGKQKRDGLVDNNELRVTLFRARYDKNGELTIRDRQSICSYGLYRCRRYPFNLKAFLI
ncbi:hypothetical protein QOZ80_8BG0649140 [Eleusine coracana subsp. coracana]|nr:hypothetical protein QOZ80_8BG0649140 [Eleusine coracana subsp. coracana]